MSDEPPQQSAQPLRPSQPVVSNDNPGSLSVVDLANPSDASPKSVSSSDSGASDQDIGGVLADGGGVRLMPCKACLGRIGREGKLMTVQCRNQLGEHAQRCQKCANGNHSCKEIPESAYDAVNAMLDVRGDYIAGRVSVKQWTKLYKIALKATKTDQGAESDHEDADLADKNERELLMEIVKLLRRAERNRDAPSKKPDGVKKATGKGKKA